MKSDKQILSKTHRKTPKKACEKEQKGRRKTSKAF